MTNRSDGNEIQVHTHRFAAMAQLYGSFAAVLNLYARELLHEKSTGRDCVQGANLHNTGPGWVAWRRVRQLLRLPRRQRPYE
jgi:hypothetical protein